MNAAVKRSYCSTQKKEVEALRWLMQCVFSIEQIICGLHEIGRSFCQQEKTDAKHPELIPEFDAVYAWTSRDKVIIERMTAYLARERQNFVEMKEMEKHILSPIDTEGTIGIFSWSACDREGRRRFVAVKSEKTTWQIRNSMR